MNTILLMGVLQGCLNHDRGDAPVVPPEQLYLEAADQMLPVGLVGEAYDARPMVTGGTPPYTWTKGTPKDFPSGLELDDDGLIHGVPTEAGEHVFPLVAHDSQGREKRALMTLPVLLEPATVQCGEKLSGSFSGSGMGVEGPNFDELDNLIWMAVDLPDLEDLVQRIELVFANTSSSTLYVERATEDLGSWNVEDHYVGFYLNPTLSNMTVTLDAGTTPSLSGYESQTLLPLLLVGQSAGAWEIEVVCSDGPVVERLEQYPTEVGTEIEVDFDVWGPDENMRFTTDDPLPPWMTWNEETGEVTGIAMEEGAWEIDLTVEADDGRTRTERAILGAYEITDVPCNSVVPVITEEGYFDGDFYGYWDPRGYNVYRVPLLDGMSSLDLTLSGSDAHYLGIANPAPDWLKFYAGADRVYATGVDGELSVEPRSYPDIGHYVVEGEIYVIAASTGSLFDMSMAVDCLDDPRPDLHGMPVVEPLTPADYELGVIGGTAPYTWSATGLPSGLSVAGGRLTGTTGEIGTFDVSLTVEDKDGNRGTEDYELYSGLDEACANATPIDCGDSVDGTFTTTYFSDDSGPGSTEVFCFVDRGDLSLGYEIYADQAELRVDVADPGATVDDLLHGIEYTYLAYVDRDSAEGVALNPWSWPDLDDYQDLPVLLAIRAYEAGDWTLHLTCE